MDARDELIERLLGIMERKVHWAWPSFTSGLVPKDRLHIHLEHEYGVYVRDFPVMVGRAYVQCPIAAVRRELAENLYEEETGGIRAGRPHPELFLEYPRGLGMDLSRFERPDLLPAARAFRGLLDDATTQCGWAVATAVTTLFLEGTPHDRSVVDPNVPARARAPLEEHPLVRHYGLPLEALALTRAHRGIEGEHRAAAWKIAREHIPIAEHAPVIDTMESVLQSWLAYRDAVAEAVGLQRPT